MGRVRIGILFATRAVPEQIASHFISTKMGIFAMIMGENNTRGKSLLVYMGVLLSPILESVGIVSRNMIFLSIGLVSAMIALAIAFARFSSYGMRGFSLITVVVAFLFAVGYRGYREESELQIHGIRIKAPVCFEGHKKSGLTKTGHFVKCCYSVDGVSYDVGHETDSLRLGDTAYVVYSPSDPSIGEVIGIAQ